MPIRFQLLPNRGAAAAPVLGALVVLATVSLHHSLPSAHAAGQSAIVVGDAARAAVVGVAHGAVIAARA